MGFGWVRGGSGGVPLCGNAEESSACLVSANGVRARRAETNTISTAGVVWHCEGSRGPQVFGRQFWRRWRPRAGGSVSWCIAKAFEDDFIVALPSASVPSHLGRARLPGRF